MNIIKKEFSIFIHGVIFFTRIPIKNHHYNLKHEREILRYFSFIGFFLSLLQISILYTLIIFLPLSISLIITFGLNTLITGALHEDGLADSFDALWGGSTIEKRQEILRDSSLGTYGVLALISIYFFKFEIFKLLEENLFRFIIMGNIISRFFFFDDIIPSKI